MHTKTKATSRSARSALAVALLCAMGAAAARAQTPLRLGSEFVVNTFTTGAQQSPAVAARDEGFVVAWASQNRDGSGLGVAARVYAASGVPGAEFVVNTATTLNQYAPAVAAAPDGRFVVAWREYTGGYSIVGQRYQSSGLPAGGAFVVSTLDVAASDYQPSVAMGADGSYVVVWSGDEPDFDPAGILGRRFASNGTPLGPQFQVSADSPGYRDQPATAVLADGGFVVVWRSDDQDGSVRAVVARRYDSSGAPAGSEFVVNSYTTGYQEQPAVAARADGGFVVVWQSEGADNDPAGMGIAGQRYNASGAPVGGEFVANTYTTGVQAYPAVASVDDGGFVVVWSTTTNVAPFDVAGQRYDASGAPVGGEFAVNSYTTGGQAYPVVAPEVGGGFVVTWQSAQDGSGTAVVGQRYVMAPIPGSVVGHQKISDLAGGFGGILDDADQLGGSVAALGDLDGDGVTDLAVGADADDDGGSQRGAVWVLFLNTDGTVRAEQKISDLAGGFGGTLDNADRFGSGVAALGDLDGDNVRDVAVGAPGDDDGGSGRGAVWVLLLNADGTVKDEQKISQTAGGFGSLLADGDAFGSSVGTLGDVDDDGVPDLAVGAPLDYSGGFAGGAVWVLFLNADGTVKDEQKIDDVAGSFGGVLEGFDTFGAAVAGLGDLDGDTVPDLAVGASGDNDGATGPVGVLGPSPGAVWILFLNADGTVKAEQRISQTAGVFDGPLGDEDAFGTAVANVGDLDGDGISDLAVGAPGADDGGRHRGAVWLVLLNADGTAKHQQRISDVLGGFDGVLDDADNFGRAVAPLGDLDGDGETDLAVGASRDDDGGPDRGAVWVLFHDATPIVELTATYTQPTVVSGPLSLGLAALPTEVTATFRFVSPGLPPPLGVPLSPTVLAASLSYGDAQRTVANLTSFSVTFAAPGVLSDLTYSFAPIDTSTSTDGILLNHDFALHVMGVDRATGQPFEYRHARSAETVAPAVPPACPAAPSGACVTGFTTGVLAVDERTPGAEKLLAKWTGGPALAGADFGNPLDAAGTAYRLCVYDDANTLAGHYDVDRAGYLCGGRPCWTALGRPPGDPNHKGYKYRDTGISADGLQLVRMKGGGAGQSKALVRGKNTAAAPPTLPTGVAAALAGSSSATIQLIGSDAPACLSVTLPTVVLDDGNRFKAKL